MTQKIVNIHTVWKFAIFCLHFFYKSFEKFREINLVRKICSKMVLVMTQLRSFGANLRKSCRNMTKSRRFGDLKSIEKIGIHWTQTKLFEHEVEQFQLPFTDH